MWYVWCGTVHGGWTGWEESECVGTCSRATKTRRRTCTNPAPRYEGRLCGGPSEEVFKCIPENCNCEWGTLFHQSSVGWPNNVIMADTCEYDEWSDWSPCSLTCGVGSQTRTRGLLNNITEAEANNCDLVETRSCSIVGSCPTCEPSLPSHNMYAFINWPILLLHIDCQRITVGREKMMDINGCETDIAWPVFRCVGPCDRGDQGCCAISRKRRQMRPVRCPGQEYLRDSRFDFIWECSCTGDCQESEPLQPFWTKIACWTPILVPNLHVLHSCIICSLHAIKIIYHKFSTVDSVNLQKDIVHVCWEMTIN